MSPIDSNLVDLIGAIYDAVLEPAGWHETLDRIRRHFHFHNAILGIVHLGHERDAFTVPVNIPERYLTMQTPEYNEEAVRMWGGREQLASYPLEEPFALLKVTDQRELAGNKYYLDFGVPQGLVDQAAIVLTRDRRQVGNVSFGRHRDIGPVTDDIIAGIRILAPHLRRAALIGGILEEERRTKTMFEAVLVAVRSSIILVDRKARIIYANPAAETIIEAGDPLCNERGTLQLRGEVVPGQLQAAIEKASEGDIPLGRRGIAIPGTRADTSPFVAHVLPLGNRTAHTGMPGEAIAAVFVADRDEEPRFVIDATTMIYGLTPTEARVFDLIIAGHSSAEMAKLLAIAPSTLKWHTLQLFDKTGKHRRVDLVRLAAALGTSG